MVSRNKRDELLTEYGYVSLPGEYSHGWGVWRGGYYNEYFILCPHCCSNDDMGKFGITVVEAENEKQAYEHFSMEIAVPFKFETIDELKILLKAITYH